MKKFILICLFTSLVANISAQQLRYGVIGGLNVSMPSESYDGRVGFNIGAKMEMDAPFVGKGVFFDTSLMLSQKGMKNTWGNLTYGNADTPADIESWGSQTLNPTYMQLNVGAGYKFSVCRSVDFFVKGGPYAAVGVFGNNKITEETALVTKTNHKESVFKNEINRFDWGLGLSVGANLFNHYQVSVSHDWGLKDFSKSRLVNAKHRTLYFSLAYMF